MVELVVLTPTYNRRKTLERLYKSLKEQSNKNFIWLIIDDGSSDGTLDYVNEIQKENIITIEYYHKENGGKGSALNYAFEKKKNNSFLLVVDSDDYLLPDSIAKVRKNVDIYNKDSIGGIFFHYQFKDGEGLLAPKKKLKTNIVSNRYSYNKDYGKHDGCIGYYSRSISKYQYPVFENEKYIGPTVIQMAMSDEFDIVFSTDIIGVAEYQNDGITKTGRILRLQNPKGMIHYGLLQLNDKNSILTRLKYAISIWPYAFEDQLSMKDVLKLTEHKLLTILTYIPGKILHYKWKRQIKI